MARQDVEYFRFQKVFFELIFSDLNELLLNYFLVEGYSDAAKTFAQETNQEIDARLVSDVLLREQLKGMILDGKILEAIRLINDIYPELLSKDLLLRFALKKQHLIELIREGHSKEAVGFAQKDLLLLAETKTELMDELEEAMALLAYTGTTKRKTKKQEIDVPKELLQLLEQEQREKLSQLLNSTILEEVGILRPESKISNLIRLMYWAQSLLEESGANFPHIEELLLNLGNKTKQA